MWIRIASFILRNRLPILFVLILLTAFMGYQSRKMEMSYQYAPLLPEDDAVYQEYEHFVSRFGNEGNLMVLGVQDSLFFDEEHYKYWQELTDGLVGIDGITSVLSAADAYQLERDNDAKKFRIKSVFNDDEAPTDSLIQMFGDMPFYKGLLYNEKTHTYLVGLTLDTEVLESSGRVGLMGRIVDVGNSYEAVSGNELRYSGLPFIRVETAQMIKKELNMFIWLALGIAALIIFLFFRSFKVVIFSMLVVGMAVVWALGILGMTGFKINILTGMIPPLIIVIGVPNSVFLLNKFHYEFRNHGNKMKSLQRVIRKIGNATFLTNVTTASGFATFIFTNSQLLVEFGILAAINILVVFVLSILLIPIIFSFLPDPKERHVKHLDRPFLEKVLHKLVHISLNHKRAVFAGSLGLLIVGGFGISRMQTTGYMLDDIPHEHQLYQDLKFFEDHFSGLMPLEIMVDTKESKGVMKQHALQKIDDLQDELSAFPELSKGLSLSEVVKFARQAYYNGGPQQYKLPGRMERNFIMSYIPQNEGEGPEFVSSFVDSTRQRARISFRMADVGTTRMKDLNRDIRAVTDSIFPAEDYETSVTGSSIVFFKG
ncbi:MAG: efflux RND transporter permease subunit, partial [Marinilabiliaceae bacterium]